MHTGWPFTKRSGFQKIGFLLRSFNSFIKISETNRNPQKKNNHRLQRNACGDGHSRHNFPKTKFGSQAVQHLPINI